MNSPQDSTSLGIVGAGVMAEAMLAGIVRQGIIPLERVVCSHPREARRKELEERFGIRCVPDNREAGAARLVLLAVKPQVLIPVMRELRKSVKSDAVVVSIVAGASIDTLHRGLGHDAIIRAMPNTPAQIGQGLTVWHAAGGVTNDQREQVRTVLASLGSEIEMADETDVAKATAVSGTGPTYVFLFLESMIDAAVHMGFPRQIARKLVLETVSGSTSFAISTGLHAAQLRDMVTSPGGTSAAALYELERGRFRTVVSDAMWSAFRRTAELERNLDERAAED